MRPNSAHQPRLAGAAWSKRIQHNGRAMLVFSEMARPLAALVVTGTDAQLVALCPHEATCHGALDSSSLYSDTQILIPA